MGDFYGIGPGVVPGFADAGDGRFMSVEGLPEHTVRNMALFMDGLHDMYEDDPLAFEICVWHIASAIEGQLRAEAKADPRDGSSFLAARFLLLSGVADAALAGRVQPPGCGCWVRGGHAAC